VKQLTAENAKLKSAMKRLVDELATLKAAIATQAKRFATLLAEIEHLKSGGIDVDALNKCYANLTLTQARGHMPDQPLPSPFR